MTRSPEREDLPRPAAESATVTMEPTAAKLERPSSPTRSDRSSDSEGKPVREKLKETRIDAQATTNRSASSDQPMNDAPTNGVRGDISTSGSDSERGRLRRKRSRENFEDDNEDAKQPGKKQERHIRKKSRDVNSPVDAGLENQPLANSAVEPICKNDDDETMEAESSLKPESSTAERQATPEIDASEQEAGITSPKNKRTREQAEAGVEAALVPVAESTDSVSHSKVGEERTTKRLRDGVESSAVEGAADQPKIPPGSGFANISSDSPFAKLSPTKKAPETTDASAKDLPQTSNQAFKKSGFGSFANASASPFGASSTGGTSPFGTASGAKVSSFASSASTTTKSSGFASLAEESTAPSAFGGSPASKPVFGGSLSGGLSGSGFGNLGSSKGPSTFGSGSAITGLSKKPNVPFGTAQLGAADEDDGSDPDEGQENEDGDEEAGSERRTSQPLLNSQAPLETGEENEDTMWVGRAKLYTLAGEAGKKSWQERGVGSFKVNLTREAPTKARFVLRADGTHRLLLNAAITSTLRLGDADGGEPKDGKVLFTAPTTSGEVESHTLKLKADRAADLWKHVESIKSSLAAQ